MEQSPGLAFIKSIWCAIEIPTESRCCHCGMLIPSNSVLMRTFSLESHLGPEKVSFTRKIEVPSLSEVVIVYERHLECLFQFYRFVSISHVWDAGVADVQYRREEAEASIEKVADLVREEPVWIYQGLVKSLEGHFEVWHDYISVPQWQADLKRQIIAAIPRIYHRARPTVAFLSDTDIASFAAIREGKSGLEISRGVSDVCNAKYFSRVWTGMELTQSGEQLLVMLSDYTLLDNNAAGESFLDELHSAWGAQVAKQGNPHSVEHSVGIGQNLVPWQLGPLSEIWRQNLQGEKTAFAEAYLLLACRCVTRPRDFFHGLLGTLRTDLAEAQLADDTQAALLQVAWICIADGDFSPLLMIPGSILASSSEEYIRWCGYLNLSSFALGYKCQPSTHRHVVFHPGNKISIQAEDLGPVQFAARIDWSKGNIASLSTLLRLTLQYTGLNIDAVVKGLGGCLYGQEPQTIFDRLSNGDLLSQFREKLRLFYNSIPNQDSENLAQWIADAMGLSNRSLNSPMTVLTPMNYLNAHGSTLHLGEPNMAIIGLRCDQCHETFLVRVAMLRAPSEAVGLRAHRIPGLQYRFTLAGGAGFLLGADGSMVARFAWGTPTCECPKLKEVKIHLHNLPLPRPNTSKYGRHARGH